LPWSGQPKKPVPPATASISALSPNHCVIRSGSVSADHTLAMGAAMSMLRVMSSVSMVSPSSAMCNPTIAHDTTFAQPYGCR
jgi:hypothetical protein